MMTGGMVDEQTGTFGSAGRKRCFAAGVPGHEDEVT